MGGESKRNYFYDRCRESFYTTASPVRSRELFPLDAFSFRATTYVYANSVVARGLFVCFVYKTKYSGIVSVFLKVREITFAAPVGRLGVTYVTGTQETLTSYNTRISPSPHGVFNHTFNRRRLEFVSSTFFQKLSTRFFGMLNIN